MSDHLKKRAWLQIHLSTAVVLLLATGVLFWINVYTQYFTYHTPAAAEKYWPAQALRERFSDYDAGLDQLGTVRFNHKLIGWPCTCYRYILAGFGHFNNHRQFIETAAWRGKTETEFDAMAAMIDAGVIAAVLVLIWLLCEGWIRWREPRIVRGSA